MDEVQNQSKESPKIITKFSKIHKMIYAYNAYNNGCKRNKQTIEKIQEGKFGEASFYSRYEKATGTKTERFRQALSEEYYSRTEEFRRKNGYIIVEYNGEEKTLDEWYEMFETQQISKEQMNEIIDLTKTTNEYTKDIYNSTNQNTDISAYFE